MPALGAATHLHCIESQHKSVLKTLEKFSGDNIVSFKLLFGVFILGLSLAFYEPLRGALVDLFITLRVSSTIAGFRAYRASSILPLLDQKQVRP